MKLISHRGNTVSCKKKYENHPEYIMEAYSCGFDVEIDVWNINGEFYLGHDEPQYKTDWEFITNSSFWCHAKNFEALLSMRKCGANCFWHEKDSYTLTSSGYIWTYPNKLTSPESIIVCKNQQTTIELYNAKNVYGICSDFVGVLK